MLAEQTNEFIQGQLEDLRTRLIRQKQQLNAARHAGSPQAETLAIEYEVLEATFKDLLTKLEESRMSVNLDRHQIGEQFTLLDPPGWPKAHSAPTVGFTRALAPQRGWRQAFCCRSLSGGLARGGGLNNAPLPLRPEASTGAQSFAKNAARAA